MKYEYKQGALIFSLFPYYFCEVSSFTLRNKAKMRFLIVADFSLQQRGKYTESFLIISGFEKKMRLSQDFFYRLLRHRFAAAGVMLRGWQYPRRDRGIRVHSPPQITLRSSGVNKIRPLRGRKRWCNNTTATHLSKPRSPRSASIQDGCVQTMPTCSADAMNRIPTICF